ncbi:DUF2585 domain-containing protein [Paracoccus sp. Z118]|uniref:DUF2585 family protein n=1 Tax=Paracoccus sp. Z118 TaxID=2851017 RepID=UPI001C2BB47D|nr:DUF2585 family protein [Paracoccus sp. Z118]MBV0893261.1 DUF2585 domain-containing protein [Paracoccus sp. Z118]
MLATPPALEVALGILLVNGAVVLWLLLLGRGVLPDGVPLQWWSGSTLTADNSQHLADFYSALHAISGAALYFAARAICPEWPLRRRFIMVIACSGVWEVVENTPAVIALFNDPGSLNVYRGDSIVNALSDTAFVAFGFLAAHSLPRWLIIATGALAEFTVALIIHDGFVLGTARVVLR